MRALCSSPELREGSNLPQGSGSAAPEACPVAFSARPGLNSVHVARPCSSPNGRYRPRLLHHGAQNSEMRERGLEGLPGNSPCGAAIGARIQRLGQTLGHALAEVQLANFRHGMRDGSGGAALGPGNGTRGRRARRIPGRPVIWRVISRRGGDGAIHPLDRARGYAAGRSMGCVCLRSPWTVAPALDAVQPGGEHA